ncbi:MAG: hypothetical protein U0V75_11845 [Ferruginibacter sp.]
MNLKTIAIIAVAASVASCKKEKPAGTGNPTAGSKLVTVILNPGYLPLSKVDSAFITWENGIKTDSVKLETRENDLAVSFGKLPATEKKFQLHLFSSILLKQQKLLWNKEFTVALSQKQALNIAAPMGFADINWKPRLILKDGAGLQVFSGLRPDDPYFRIHRIDRQWTTIVMDRSYWNTIGPDTKVGGATWNGVNMLDETGSYSNSIFFNMLPLQMGNKAWNHYEIVMLFTNSTNTQTRVMDFYYTA